MDEIWVTYNDGIMGTVPKSDLQQLIELEKIIKFHRADGWAYLGIDPIRNSPDSDYTGPERRKKREMMKPKSGSNRLALADINELINRYR